MDLAISIRAIQLADRLLQEKIPGVIETLPMFVSVLVHYDLLVLAPGHLKEVLFSIWSELSCDKEIVVRSRLIEIPVLYCDPWNKECVEEYSRTIHPMEDNPTYVARINGLSDVNELVQLHSRGKSILGRWHWFLSGSSGFHPARISFETVSAEVQSAENVDAAGRYWGGRRLHFALPHERLPADFT